MKSAEMVREVPCQSEMLEALYKEIFDEDFNDNNSEQQLKLQSALYILGNLGVHIGKKSFSWCQYAHK